MPERELSERETDAGVGADTESTTTEPTTTEPTGSDGAAGATATGLPLPVVFRIQRTVYFVVPMMLVTTLVLAGTSLPLLGWTIVLPFVAAFWIHRIRTVVTDDGITAVGTFSTRTIEWSSLAGLSFPRWGSVQAVLTDGSKVRLPAIAFTDLPVLSVASRGRIPDPYAAGRTE
ncbi:PH domain-containing protein [Williamsia sp. CHRR-6]|uniref:PH domain-containing protein n=1 Tax=Williamsia sp. CHRR-6 TaxID=2835871 RepID=UPI001BDB08CC|nr:PH domain-containing protein [Williamsia sp. CHRR-6]MBT0565451.1 PH domain-containing protein [Williamsia sp. CHRR-6]